MEIKKKCWTQFFDDIKSGRKRFDLRLADEPIKEGDVMVLREWDPSKKEYTGREIKKRVTYVLKTKDLNPINFWSEEDIQKHGYIVLSLEDHKPKK